MLAPSYLLRRHAGDVSPQDLLRAWWLYDRTQEEQPQAIKTCAVLVLLVVALLVMIVFRVEMAAEMFVFPLLINLLAASIVARYFLHSRRIKKMEKDYMDWINVLRNR